MSWDIQFHDLFDVEFAELAEPVQNELLAVAQILSEFGPQLGRPHVDTLNGSKHAKMKELRFRADNGVWRVALAFDPARKAVLLVAANKAGVSQRRFYRLLVATADSRFDEWTAKLRGGKS